MSNDLNWWQKVLGFLFGLIILISFWAAMFGIAEGWVALFGESNPCDTEDIDCDPQGYR